VTRDDDKKLTCKYESNWRGWIVSLVKWHGMTPSSSFRMAW